MQLTIASTVAQNNKIDKAKKSKITNKLSSNTACLWLDPLWPNHKPPVKKYMENREAAGIFCNLVKQGEGLQ